jgi:hypothetical protein
MLSRINGGTMTQTSIGIQEVGVPGTYHDMAEWMIIGEFSDMVGHDDLFLQFDHVLSSLRRGGSWSRLIHVGQKWGWLQLETPLNCRFIFAIC